MRKRSFIITVVLGVMTLAAMPTQVQPAETAAGVQETRCFSACFRSPLYCRLNLERMSGIHDAMVVIGGVNYNQPVSVTQHTEMVRQTLQGSAFPGLPPASPLARLNQDFVATQLSLAGHDELGVLNGQLQCYDDMLSFRPVVLSNGATLTPYSTLGELFDETLLAIRENRTEDMDGLAGLFHRLNGDDPSANGLALAQPIIRVPQDYPTIQQAIDAAQPGDVIKVGAGEFKGASVNKPVTLIGEGANTRITSGVGVPRVMTDPGFPAFAFVGFLVSFGGSGATISNFSFELTAAPRIPNPILAIGVHVRHADEVTVIHNQIIGPGAAALPQYTGVYLFGANRCIVALNKMDGSDSGVAVYSDPFINTPTTRNQITHNRMSKMRIGIILSAHRMNPATGFGPEQPVSENYFFGNLVQGQIGLRLNDQAPALRDFIRDNRFVRNDFRQCTTPYQESAAGLAGKNSFSMNLGL